MKFRVIRGVMERFCLELMFRGSRARLQGDAIGMLQGEAPHKRE